MNEAASVGGLVLSHELGAVLRFASEDDWFDYRLETALDRFKRVAAKLQAT